MGKKIGILLENRFIDREILYYQTRFAEEGLEPVFLTRLWGAGSADVSGNGARAGNDGPQQL